MKWDPIVSFKWLIQLGIWVVCDSSKTSHHFSSLILLHTGKTSELPSVFVSVFFDWWMFSSHFSFSSTFFVYFLYSDHSLTQILFWLPCSSSEFLQFCFAFFVAFRKLLPMTLFQSYFSSIKRHILDFLFEKQILNSSWKGFSRIPAQPSESLVTVDHSLVLLTHQNSLTTFSETQNFFLLASPVLKLFLKFEPPVLIFNSLTGHSDKIFVRETIDPAHCAKSNEPTFTSGWNLESHAISIPPEFFWTHPLPTHPYYNIKFFFGRP